jgi:peptidyl-prolyl cis-trans isomerase D
MLQTIRERAQGWIAWAIVILISIPFALWGIQSYLGVGSEPVVATVNGVEITEREFDSRYHEARLRLRERLGAAYRPELFEEKTMRRQVLETMIQDTLLLQVAHDLGLRASDQELREAIRTYPAFQKDGRFDKATYERMLELQGMRPTQYEDNLRQGLVRTQLSRAVVASELVTEVELKEAVRLQRQERRVKFVRVPRAAFINEEPIPDAELRAYYEANLNRFQTPERVRVRYVVLDTDKIDATETPDEATLRSLYEAERERFRQPEQRTARHILITLDADADAAAAAAARQRIEGIRQRIEAGEDFAALASELSEDPGSAGEGGNLGTFERGLMDPAFDQAAFSLALNELSAPVRSQFGYHLIEVTEVQPASVKSFEEVRGELASELAKRNAEGAYYDWAERLANLSYENPDSLEPAAEALGLPIQTSEWIDRNGGEGVLGNPKVVAAAFSEEVLREGLNSDLIEPERDVQRALVLRVVEHEEAAAKPFDRVREEIEAVLRDQRATESANAAVNEMIQRLEAGEQLEEVIGDYGLTELGLVSRTDAKVPPGVRDLAFRLPRPQKDEAVYEGTVLDEGDAALVVVTDVVDGSVDPSEQGQQAQIKAGLARAAGNAYYDALVSDLESRADITRKDLRDAAAL